MTDQRRETYLILRIDLDADPIAGSIEAPDGQAHPFSGWISLTATLTSTCHTAATQLPAPSTDSDEPLAFS